MNLSCLNSLHCYEFFFFFFLNRCLEDRQGGRKAREKENIMVEPCQPWLSNLAMTLQRVCVWPGHTWLWLRTVAGLYGPDIFTIYTTGAGQRQEKRRKTKSPLCVKTLIFPPFKDNDRSKGVGIRFQWLTSPCSIAALRRDLRRICCAEVEWAEGRKKEEKARGKQHAKC